MRVVGLLSVFVCLWIVACVERYEVKKLLEVNCTVMVFRPEDDGMEESYAIRLLTSQALWLV